MLGDIIKFRVNFCNVSKTIEGTWVSPTGKQEWSAFKSEGDVHTSFGFEGELMFIPPVNYLQECSIDVILHMLNIEKRYTYEQVMQAVQETYVMGVMEA